MLFLPCVAQPCCVVIHWMPSLRSQFLPHKSRIPIISGRTRHECVLSNERWSMPKAECRCDVTSALIIESPLLQMPSLFSPLCILVYDTYSHRGCSMLINKKASVSCAKSAHGLQIMKMCNTNCMSSLLQKHIKNHKTKWTQQENIKFPRPY